MSQSPDFDISSLIELARHKKYEATTIGFNILDKIERVPVPKKLQARKIAVQALYSMAGKSIQYKYFSKEEKEEIQAQLEKAHIERQMDSNTTGAPVISEEIDEEELPPEVVDEQKEDGDDDEDDDDSFDDDEEEED